MEETPYTERILTIADRNRAAVLITFGAKLQSHMPLEWVEEFASVDAYLAWRRDRTNPKLQPEIIVTLNFVPDGVDAKGIAKAYNDPDAEDKFTALIRELVELGKPSVTSTPIALDPDADPEDIDLRRPVGIDAKTAEKILALHSNATVSISHQALDAREWLIERLAQCPETAKWIQVRGHGKGQRGRFGKQATTETIAGVLEKIS